MNISGLLSDLGITIDEGRSFGSNASMVSEKIRSGLPRKESFDDFNRFFALSLSHLRARALLMQMSATTGYSGAQLRQLNSLIDDVYGEFVKRVSEGRKLPVRQVKRVAGGRVWTGEDAYRLGLVDQLGGIEDALLAAKKLCGLEESAPTIEIKSKKPYLSQAKSFFGGSAGGLLLDCALATMLGWEDATATRALATQINGRPALLEPTCLFKNF